MKHNNKLWGDILLLANGFVLAVVLNQLASIYFFRLDLTEEARYSIKQPTKDLLQKLDDDLYIEVYLEGDLNAGFRRLRKAVRETLEEFRLYSKNKVHYTFTDPAAAQGKKAQQEFMSELASKGIQPMNVIDTKNGQRTEKLVFPGALIAYAGAETGVRLVKGNRAQGSEEVLNQSIEGLEFEFAKAIEKLSNESPKRIGMVSGHGELDSMGVASLRNTLTESYSVSSVNLSSNRSLESFAVLIIAKPVRSFVEEEIFRLDQFVMHGGKLLLMIDRLEANMDSIARKDYFAFPYALGLDDALFHYGVRVNNDLVQDMVSIRWPVVTGNFNGKSQITPIEWPFFPMINHYADHPITRNLDACAMHFVSSVDSVKAKGIRKTPLLFTSPYSRKVIAPVKVSVNDLRREIKPENFSGGPLVLAYLLEGKFSSIYKNRFLPEGADSASFLSVGVESKIIIVADGDLARNELNPRTGQPLALGFDNYSGYTFANEELIMNMISYLADDTGLIGTRNRQVKVRPLDKERVKDNRKFLQTVNVLLPIALIAILGFGKGYWRKIKFSRFGLGKRSKGDGSIHASHE